MVFIYYSLALSIDYRISAIGAIAFAFSSYFFIIFMAGHMTKAHAIAYVPMVVAAVLYTYRGNILLGGVLTSLAVAIADLCKSSPNYILFSINIIINWYCSIF